MVTILNSGTLRSMGYLALAVLAVLVGWRERSSPDRQRLALWPLYWWLTAALLLTVGVAHLGGFGDYIIDIGREQARSAGWYGSRRKVQAAAVLIFSYAWFMTVLLAIWRVPPRRRRYLPSAIAVGTLLAFVAVRAISLHQIDSLLYRRDVLGLRGVTVIETTLLVVAGLSILTRWDVDSTTARPSAERVDALS